jgi:hypothetical protein
MRRGGGGKIARVAAGLLGAVVLALVIAQLLLPGIAADDLRSRVARYGRVLSVSVSAFPAIELLWGHADSVHVTTAMLRLSPRQAASLLWEARDAHSLDVSAAHVVIGGLTVGPVTLAKRGNELRGEGITNDHFVRGALPPHVGVRLLSSSSAGVLVRVSGGLFGATGPLDALASASGGKLIVRPQGSPLAGAQLTLFSDPHVQITGIGADSLGRPLGIEAYALSLSGRLR